MEHWMEAAFTALCASPFTWRVSAAMDVHEHIQSAMIEQQMAWNLSSRTPASMVLYTFVAKRGLC
jgi:hypothetical protein